MRVKTGGLDGRGLRRFVATGAIAAVSGSLPAATGLPAVGAGATVTAATS